MNIGGFQKLTLIDYPGRLATTVFTIGCSFRCPFCHNPELIGFNPNHNNQAEENFFKFLKSRKGKIEGVCITGGEPTVQNDLIEFIRKIRKLGFFVKLDTNGTRPDVLRKLFQENLLDFVAMDIKNYLEKYEKTVGTKVDLGRIKLSVELIRNSGVNYEFRTTVVPGLHTISDFTRIAEWIGGSKAYYLQEYREGKILDQNLKKKTRGKSIDLEEIKAKIEKNFDKMGIRK